MHAPLVGRERELAALQGAYAQALATRGCHVCTVVGPAGIGKSRLARAWLDGLAGEATVVSGRCLHYGEGITFWPLVEVLIQLGPPAAEVLQRVEQGGAGSPQELFWEVRKLLERIAAERPLVVVLDDLQWAEPMLLDLVEHIAVLSRAAPIVLLCLARPDLLDEHPEWAARPDATTVLLEPLDAAEAGRLLDQLDAAIEPALRERIVGACEGNPLFLEETFAFLSEQDEAGVPPTIQALLAARLEQLRDEQRGVVERGAVEGKVFHRGAVVELAPDQLRTGIDTHLGALVRKDLIQPVAPVVPDDDAFGFRTLLIRDAAYEALPKQSRAELHERFAGWIERRGGELVELHEIAGWHLEQAVRFRRELGLPVDDELATRAAHHLGLAGRRAAERTDHHAAENLLSRARALLPEGDPERARIALDLADVLVLATVDPTVIVPLLAEAEAEPTTRTHAAVARLVWDVMLDAEFDIDASRAQLAAAIGAFERAGDEGGLAKAHLALFHLHWASGHAGPADAALAAAVEHATRAGRLAIAAQANALRTGPVAFGPDGPAETERKLAEIEASGRGPLVAAGCAMTRSEIHRRAGRFDAARAEQATVAEQFRDGGFELLYASSGQLRGYIEVQAGDPAEGVRVLRESVAASHALGDMHGFAPTTEVMLAQALYAAGDLDAAAETALAAKEHSTTADIGNFIAADSVIALVRLRQGDVEAAKAFARAAVEQAVLTDFPVVRAEAELALATVLAAAGDRDEALAAAHRALALYERKGDEPGAGPVRALLAELAPGRVTSAS